MGLLDGTTQREYYQDELGALGNYQFTSLDDIITQFEIAYVGENKIIPKIKRTDISFYAKRALQELSFDTFKSIKSQQIDLPPSLTMDLPHDYVNYTKVSWADSSGIKHPLYPTKHTSNPFQIKQEANGDYFFGDEFNKIINPDFDDDLFGTWSFSNAGVSGAWDSTRLAPAHVDDDGTMIPDKYFTNYISDSVGLAGDNLEFSILWNSGYGHFGSSRAYAAWQRLDTTHDNILELKATATSGAQQTSGSDLICDYGVVRVGVTTTNPTVGWVNENGVLVTANRTVVPEATNTLYTSPNANANNYELGYVEWNDGTTSEKELLDIDVSGHNEVWVYIQSFSPWTAAGVTTITAGVANGGTTPIAPSFSANNTPQKNYVSSVSLIAPGNLPVLSSANSDKNSSTWNSYKALTPSENNSDDYEDDTYWPMNGERYGLDPQHAQANGSFYIDQRLGRIHFSSNVSGKAVILDYISDSLGTDAEMQVHKFAEDAMYKWIAHAVLSTSSYGQPLVPRLTKEKFAAIRKAKLRLSNIKLEELTQILRGKSKQIKH